MKMVIWTVVFYLVLGGFLEKGETLERYQRAAKPRQAKTNPLNSNAISPQNRNQLERIAFGEARGEGQVGQEAVVRTVVNRYNGPRNFPTRGDDRLKSIMNQEYKDKYGKLRHDYNTLDNTVQKSYV